ncbi:MAG: ribonuclease R [Planctomycetota bacterium]
MPKRFSDRILSFLQQPGYRPLQAVGLARAMGIAEAEYGDFHEAVDALRRVGRVVLGTGNAVMLNQPRGEAVGTYRANPRGFGFVVPDEPTVHGDLYIAAGASLDAVTGDTVLCRVLRRGKRDGRPAFGGRIVRVLKRGNSRFVGRLRQEGGIWFVQPDGNTLHVPILIGDAGAKSCRSGDQVVVEIVRYPSEGKPAKGVIVERLGKSGRPGVDLLSVIRQYQLPDTFPPAVLDEARAVIDAFDPSAAAESREDLSKLTIITIDPDDARDFDDAISLEHLEPTGTRGGSARKRGQGKAAQAEWELGVHIADVSTFVRLDSELDEEAQARGTSVYFPGHVIPMLPEVLSNGVCSLQQDEPRLCKSAFIRYDAKGRVVATRFANTVIRSAQRLTYGQATAILEGKHGRFRKAIVELLQQMDELARIIRRRRLDDGMIVLDLPEVELILDDSGRVVDAKPADTSFSHTIIEMFMVEANEAVARLLERLGVPFLRRIHGEPDEAALDAVAKLLRAAGHTVPKQMAPADIQAILAPVRGKPEGYAVSLAVLKSMQMAEYSPDAIGHFALASKGYTHFTSPIRRYPDLMVHRLLDLHVTKQLKSHKRGGSAEVPDDATLKELGTKLSYASRQAEGAERTLKTVKVLRLLSNHVGEEFEGVVTGVTGFGMFVQHPKFLIEGLLRLEEMTGDWWEVDVKTGRVTGERTRQTFAMGSRLRVRIAEVDVSARKLDLAMTEAKHGTAKDKTAKGKRKTQKRPTERKPAGPRQPRRGSGKPGRRGGSKRRR